MLSSGITINGVELPAEFKGARIVDSVAISRDGDKYAYVTKEHDLITGEIPEDGIVQVNGNLINLKKGSRGARSGGVSISGISGSRINISGSGISVSASGGSISIDGGGGADLEEVKEAYDGVSQIDIQTKKGNIEIGTSGDDKVHFIGEAEESPSVEGGTLIAHGRKLYGTVLVPADANIGINLESKMGNISGIVRAPGNIETKMGNISIVLQAPVSVIASTNMGKTDVVDMISEGDGRYSPPTGESKGTLRVSTKMGNLTVRYENE